MEKSNVIVKTYKELLKRGKEAIEDAKIPNKVKKARNNLEATILNLEDKLLEKELAVEDAIGAFPIDFDKIVDTIDELDDIKDKIVIANKLMSERFPK